MKRLHPTAEREVLSILKEVRVDAPPLDRRQAALDCAGIINRLPQVIAFAMARRGRGRKQAAIRVLAELAADTYFHYTGKGPGSTVNHSGKLGGYYPKFVGALARAAGVAHNPAALPGLCNEVRKALSRGVSLGRSRGLSDHGEREDVRAGALKTHVARYEDYEGNAVDDPYEGWPVFGGYEPARPRRLQAYRAYLRKNGQK